MLNNNQQELERKWKAERVRREYEQEQAPRRAELAAFWRQNDAELAAAARKQARLVSRVGATTAAELLAAKERVDRDAADVRQIARLRRYGLAPTSKAIKAIELRMAARNNGVKV